MSRTIKILTASSRMSARWKAESISWGDLVTRLSEPDRFKVNSKTYWSKQTSKEERHAIKDRGGMLAGVSSSGRRKKGDISEIQLVRLDMDAPPINWLDVIATKLDGVAYLAHTTASHRPKKPRVRIVVPLSRPISDEEYRYVSRKLGARIGEEYFPDDSTWRPNQIIFWPGCPSDGEFIATEGEGDWFDVDALLESVADWKDVDHWPFTPDVARGRAGDPRTKPGTIGVFCRVYDIHEAIEKYLADTYRGGAKDRYSYVNGSLRNGLVVYDDARFAYSHHEIHDPAGGHLCNSWDLVRLHLFGHLDAKVKDKDGVRDLPSTKAMLEMVAKDRAVLIEIDRTNSRIAEEFESLDDEPDDEMGKVIGKIEPPPRDPDKWRDFLRYEGRSTIPSKSFKNLCAILRHDNYDGEARRRLSKLVKLNKLRSIVELTPHWFKVFKQDEPDPGGTSDLTDTRVTRLRLALETFWQREWPIRIVQEAIGLDAANHGYHPIRERLDTFEWDGVERLDSWLVDYCGVEDNAYTRAVGTKILVGAVSRIRNPGCQFDYMMILHGDQGVFKTTLCKILALDKREWFTELRTLDPKASAEIIQGVWIVEMCELDALNRHDINVLKAFVTITADRYRPAYGHNPVVQPRSCIVIGTTNEEEVLKDASGGRRFWPINIPRDGTKIDTEGLRAVIEQIYAEADVRRAAGETLYLEGEAAEMASREQERHRATDPWEDVILAKLEDRVRKDRYSRALPASNSVADMFDDEDGDDDEIMELRSRVCMREILEEWLKVPKERQRAGTQGRVLAAMKRSGWIRMPPRPRNLFAPRYGRPRICWQRPTPF
jgi:putative DNA primase/helicase